MLNHVLIPLDESALSEEAIPYAAQIVKEGGKITLMHYIELPNLEGYSPSVNLPPTLRETMKEQYAKLVKESQDGAMSYLKGRAQSLEGFQVHYHIHSKGDNAADAIVDAAHSLNADAIVMTTHGRSGIRRWMFGSVALKVIGISDLPIFVVPHKASESKGE
jgi:nucleotide-binding universal stress UspA family protein